MRFEDKATLNILARTINSILLLISSVIMVRYLSKNDYGTFLQIMLISNTAVMISFVGLPHSVYYYCPQIQNKKQFITQTLILGLIISVIAAAIVFLLVDFISIWLNNPNLIEFGSAISLLIIFQGLFSFRDPVYLSQNAFILNSATTLITSVFNYIPMFIAVLLGGGLKGIILVLICSNLFNLILFVTLLIIIFRRNNYINSGSSEKGEKQPRISLWEQIRYAFPIGLSSYIGIIGQQIDKYIISAIFLPSQFAIYSRGAMEIPLIGNLTYTLNDMTMPQYVVAFKEGNINEFLRLIHMNIDKVSKINFGVFAFLFFEGRFLIEFLYTIEYINATSVFRMYLFLLFFSVTVYGMIPKVTGKTKQLSYATFLSLALNIIISLSLIPLLGPIGAAAGTILGNFGYIIFLLNSASKDLCISWKIILPWKSLTKTLSSSFLSLIPIIIFHRISNHLSIPNNLWIIIMAFSIYTYAYISILNIFGLIKKEDREYLRRWLRFDLFAIMPRSMSKR